MEVTNQKDESVWLEELRCWEADGTFKVIDALTRAQASVRVRRSDGSFTPCVIHGMDFGGRVAIVRFEEAGEPCYKLIYTENLIEQNKELFPWVK